MKPIAFVGGTYESHSLPADCQRAMNLYVELDKEGGVPAVLLGTPGLVLQYTLGGIVRGENVMRDRVFMVGGNTLYETTGGGSPIALGTLGTTFGPVSMANNGRQLLIVDGAAGYLYDGTFLTITDVDFPNGVTKAAWEGQYFIVGVDGTQQFFISDLADGSTWNGLDFASAENKPELLISMIVTHDRLMLLGQLGSEQWVNTGNSQFPFERDNGSSIEVGCEARDSVVVMNNGVYWMGRDADGGGMVFASQGSVPQRISTHAIEFALQAATARSDAYAMAYQQEGHSFYCLTVPSIERTFAFDAATQKWGERGYWNADGAFYTRWRPNCHVYAGGKHLVGDYANGNVYVLDLDAITDNGAAKRWMRRTAPSKANQARQFFSAFEIDMRTGISPEGTDAKVMLRYSNNGGENWSNERMTSIGQIGNNRRRVRFDRCGMGRNRVWEVSGTDAYRPALYGAFVDAMAAP